jgi:hypothetical protein
VCSIMVANVTRIDFCFCNEKLKEKRKWIAFECCDHSLQDFTVLPTDIFRWFVIHSSSVNFLPTTSLTETVRWQYLIPSLNRSVKKNYRWFYRRKLHAKKKSRLKYTDGFIPSVSVWNTDRLFPSVTSSVIVKFVPSYCEMPTD